MLEEVLVEIIPISNKNKEMPQIQNNISKNKFELELEY